MYDVCWHRHANGRGAVRVIWDILGHFGENCGSSLSSSWPSFRDLSSFSIQFNNALSPSDH